MDYNRKTRASLSSVQGWQGNRAVAFSYGQEAADSEATETVATGGASLPQRFRCQMISRQRSQTFPLQSESKSLWQQPDALIEW
jgi:hypothetical protein